MLAYKRLMVFNVHVLPSACFRCSPAKVVLPQSRTRCTVWPLLLPCAHVRARRAASLPPFGKNAFVARAGFQKFPCPSSRRPRQPLPNATALPWPAFFRNNKPLTTGKHKVFPFLLVSILVLKLTKTEIRAIIKLYYTVTPNSVAVLLLSSGNLFHLLCLRQSLVYNVILGLINW